MVSLMVSDANGAFGIAATTLVAAAMVHLSFGFFINCYGRQNCDCDSWP